METAVSPALSWSTEVAERFYHLDAWGSHYFHVNAAGHVEVRPEGADGPTIDLYEVVRHLRGTGVKMPLLLRFQDLLHTRVERLHEAFHRAIEEAGYGGRYQGVFPVKVNQLREVVEEILEAGQKFGYGLECGSKAELVATLPFMTNTEMLLVCNGYKDADMMRLLLAGQKLGRNVIPIIERTEEFDLMRGLVPEDQTLPANFGVRVRLSTNGAGLWAESGGEGSKFGLTLSELLEVVAQTESGTRPLTFKLLHFHLGSQLASVDNVRMAVREAGRVYAYLRKRGHDVGYVDVGGGLGVTYDAGNADVPGGINYTLGQYASAIIETLRDVCDEEGVPHPTVVSESGRAIAAYHSVLIVEAIDRREKGLPPPVGLDAAPHPWFDRVDAWGARIPLADDLSGFATQIEDFREEMTQLFRSGQFTLEQKAASEYRLWTLLRKVHNRASKVDAETALALDKQVADHYLCDFSVFHSMVDHWAIGQRFPILPIHRLDEAPTHRGTLQDLTCDSDGKVASFISPTGRKYALELHDVVPSQPYYIGVFLMGAYQDIMGDMHNLFGRVTEAHIYADQDEPDGYYVEKVIDGQTVEDILGLVQYFPNDLERRMEKIVRGEIRGGRLRPREGIQLLDLYRGAFRYYTYLDNEQEIR